ncbi:hypothetical protein GGR56DRAFT_675661 [Xylariaceae sp. FL0804]|nr:hypothetical protein GGR56DRAFT_675661 [Xylariaceae sp. FL0804]
MTDFAPGSSQGYMVLRDTALAPLLITIIMVSVVSPHIYAGTMPDGLHECNTQIASVGVVQVDRDGDEIWVTFPSGQALYLALKDLSFVHELLEIQLS